MTESTPPLDTPIALTTAEITHLMSMVTRAPQWPEENQVPRSKSVRLPSPRPHDGVARTTYMQTANCAFVVTWITGSFPDDALISFQNDYSDRQSGPAKMRWGDLVGLPYILPAPLLIPSNGTVTIESTHAGSLTLHGIEIHRRLYPVPGGGMNKP